MLTLAKRAKLTRAKRVAAAAAAVPAVPPAMPQARRLGPAVKRTISYPDYTHMDFVWDRNSKVPADLIAVLQEYSPGTYRGSEA